MKEKDIKKGLLYNYLMYIFTSIGYFSLGVFFLGAAFSYESLIKIIIGVFGIICIILCIIFQILGRNINFSFRQALGRKRWKIDFPNYLDLMLIFPLVGALIIFNMDSGILVTIALIDLAIGFLNIYGVVKSGGYRSAINNGSFYE